MLVIHMPFSEVFSCLIKWLHVKAVSVHLCEKGFICLSSLNTGVSVMTWLVVDNVTVTLAEPSITGIISPNSVS